MSLYISQHDSQVVLMTRGMSVRFKHPSRAAFGMQNVIIDWEGKVDVSPVSSGFKLGGRAEL